MLTGSALLQCVLKHIQAGANLLPCFLLNVLLETSYHLSDKACLERMPMLCTLHMGLVLLYSYKQMVSTVLGWAPLEVECAWSTSCTICIGELPSLLAASGMTATCTLEASSLKLVCESVAS